MFIRNSHIFFLLCLAALGFTSCKSDMETNKGDTALEVILSDNDIECRQRQGEQLALQISWTSGTNHGTGSAISYDLEIDLQGNDFASGIKKHIGTTDSRVVTFTNTELTDTIKHYFPDVVEEQSTLFEVRVLATIVMTGEVQISPVQTMAVSIYKKRILNLYLVGDATPGGWDAQLATRMTPDEDNPALFTYTGVMRRGEFKLLLQTGRFMPCFVRNEDDPSLIVYREQEDDYPDFKWYIPHTADYRITVNTDLLSIDTVNLGGTYIDPIYDHLYMIGSATPGGWSWDNLTELTATTDNPNVFIYEGPLFAGEIKFPLEVVHDWSGDFLLAPTADIPVENADTYVVANQPDYKWVVSTAGDYRITIDVENVTITFEKI